MRTEDGVTGVTLLLSAARVARILEGDARYPGELLQACLQPGHVRVGCVVVPEGQLLERVGGAEVGRQPLRGHGVYLGGGRAAGQPLRLRRARGERSDGPPLAERRLGR